MALSKSTNTYNRQSWEDSEFPILCQTCLGDNPYVRMMKERYGMECKICNRPFTTFRWCPGKGMRYKKTEICQTCCKIKNVCQTCLLDLEYGLPVQVRDQALQVQDNLAKSAANRDYFIQNADRTLDKVQPPQQFQEKNEVLERLARQGPFYRRNLPHICSFFVKGECKRGEECPYRHEKPGDPDDPLSDQNLRDRYYGVQDPVADKIMNRAKAMPVLKPPDDPSITTLFIGNLGNDGIITQQDVRDFFYQFGELRSVNLPPTAKGCAFVQFTTREAAEKAAEKSFNKVIIKGRKLTVRWGRAHSQQSAIEMAAGGLITAMLPPVPGLPNTLPPPDFFGSLKRAFIDEETAEIPRPSAADEEDESQEAGPSTGKKGKFQIEMPPSAGIFYPSQDPQRLGARDLQD